MDQPNTKDLSRILLFCFGLNSKNKEIKKLNAQRLYQIFKYFGKVNTIIIFSKSSILKGFIEYESNLNSFNAKNFLHD